MEGCTSGLAKFIEGECVKSWKPIKIKDYPRLKLKKRLEQYGANELTHKRKMDF